jgi:hypothetical protein
MLSHTRATISWLAAGRSLKGSIAYNEGPALCDKLLERCKDDLLAMAAQ